MTLSERRELERIADRYRVRIETECVKNHFDFFSVCDEPACELLKAIGNLLGWKLEDHGLISPPQQWARDWMQAPL